MLIPKRALLSVSDKTQIVEFGRALSSAGVELIATGNTAKMLEQAGLKVTSVESISGNPESFGGRMKTLSFQICSGILFRRENQQDLKDAESLGVRPIDLVVVNFYPFEKAVADGKSGPQLIEEIDIGGPTLVRAAAKNSPQVAVLTDPSLYPSAIQALKCDQGFKPELVQSWAAHAWREIAAYDQAIMDRMGGAEVLRYGENPHQSAQLNWDPSSSPIAWQSLTSEKLSYNNILDVTAGYRLARDLRLGLHESGSGVVIIKHGNPCGVGWSPQSDEAAFDLAWQGDPVSAFGGVIVLTKPFSQAIAEKIGKRFVEVIAAPGLSHSEEFKKWSGTRPKLKAVEIIRFDREIQMLRVSVPGGVLIQSADDDLSEELKVVTQTPWGQCSSELSQFGIWVSRALKSNAIALVREQSGALQLVGAGQGQPNRVEALVKLAIPRAQAICGSDLGELLMVSDAFFPFRDTVDETAKAGIRRIIQPGGSLRDQESIQACDEHGVSMAFTGVRHFRHG
jgi:phosphoribosylaminoimidazolecarboxamide formyltransferase/IMP cyclohydrolase